MRVSIYDVRHGFSAFVRTPNGRVMALDAGCTPESWTPSFQLAREGFGRIDRLVLSNYRDDHANDLAGLLRFAPQEYLLNMTVPAVSLAVSKAADGGISYRATTVINLVDALSSGPVAPPMDWGGAEIVHFYNSYPRDFGLDRLDDLSVVSFVHYEDAHIAFGGDLSRPGWQRLLRNPAFAAQLARVNVLVASRGGGESGCCEEVFRVCRPAVVVMANSGLPEAETERSAEWYAARASGLLVDGRTRRVLTTRRDRAIHVSYKRGFGSFLWTEAEAATRAA